MPWAGTAQSVLIVKEIRQRVGYLLGIAAEFEVSRNAWLFLGRVRLGDLLVIDNSWIGSLLSMLSLRTIYFHLIAKNNAEVLRSLC